MKKILIYIPVVLCLIAGCKKDNSSLIDGKKPEERVTEALAAYTAQLTGSPYGWKAYLYPGGGGGYSFYLQFSKENRVIMYADLEPQTAQNSNESSYRLAASQLPTLVFDTYSYLHILADPDPQVYDGTAGAGYFSDFEFSFGKQDSDTLKLTGKLLGSKLLLVKATKAEMDSYLAGTLAEAVTAGRNFVVRHPFSYLAAGDQQKVQVSIDNIGKELNLLSLVNGNIETLSSAFVFTLDGMLLENPLKFGNGLLTRLVWDAKQQRYMAVIDGKETALLDSAKPILPLYALIGSSYSQIVLPDAAAYTGWSADFTARRKKVAAAILAGPYRLRLDKMVFSFPGNNTMTLIASIYQGTTGFQAVFPFTYTKTADGIFKFTAGATSGNANLIEADMAPLTKERLNADHFTLDYLNNPETGEIMGQFKSVEHADFIFSGALQ